MFHIRAWSALAGMPAGVFLIDWRIPRFNRLRISGTVAGTR